ncbi:MAG: hypothetical protein H8E46_00115 [FCB group bacterium]|nr:hypothetical protein [FCB group bacterium]
MREELGNLIKLQEIDDSLMELEMELGNLPQSVVELKSTIENGKLSIIAYEKENEENFVRRQQLELEIDSLNEQLKKYKEQLFQVQTNREYDAINSQIDDVQVKINEFENETIQLYSREEELKGLLEDLKITQEVAGKEFSEKDAELKKKLVETKGEKHELVGERKIVVENLKKPVYNHYERIRLARDGKGVAYVYSDACGGCFSTIPPQRLVEIENMTDFIFCETCGRILVMEENL